MSFYLHDTIPFMQNCADLRTLSRRDHKRRLLLRHKLDTFSLHPGLPAEAQDDWNLSERETAEELARLKPSLAIPRDVVAYIMDTFPIVRRKDEEKWGDFHTKRVILDINDAMQEAICTTGRPFQTRLDPPPADPRCYNPPR